MKNLIIALIAVSMLSVGCLNPLSFGSTKIVHLESDQMVKDFECNDKIVADWSEWFKYHKRDGAFCIDKIGLKVFNRGEKVVIRFTQYTPGVPIAQTEVEYDVKNCSRFLGVIQDSVLFTNLRVRF